jgi:hypothetical protein
MLRARARQGAGLPGALACSQHGLGERLHRRSQRERDGVDAASSASGGEPLRLVGGKGEAVLSKEGIDAVTLLSV